MTLAPRLVPLVQHGLRLARPTTSTRRRAAELLGASAAAGAAFGAVAVASARRATQSADLRVHAEITEHVDTRDEAPVQKAASNVDAVGKWRVYTPAALALAAVALAPVPRVSGVPRVPRTRRSRIAGAAVIAAIPAVVTALSPALDAWLPQPPVGPRRRPVDHPVFPSGHAFRTTAIASTTAYVLSRECLVRGAHAWPVAAAASAAIGVSRLIRQKHLVSDVIGGWLAGLVVAGVASALYEGGRGRRR